MPRKLAKEPKVILSKIKQLRLKYGDDILSRASNLYQFCFYNFHSYKILELKKWSNDLSKKFKRIEDSEEKKEAFKKFKELTS
ncbi:hypothetical protein [Bacteriovorax sp. Seq25_V]|uniref:hypothetical protein n=1 Tax=Bacteriovorax sp. Seq25_V TaxID=1201288 RepID=UPI000414D6BA|nr:hypothetical protein [Bacteriovorax sp. Seq25_V]